MPGLDITVRSVNIFPIKTYFLLFKVEILDEFEKQVKDKNIECDCIGGGRILHEPETKHILVYGYSQVPTSSVKISFFFSLTLLLNRDSDEQIIQLQCHF